MRLAISVGVLVSEFWEMTPYELNLVARNYQERQRNTFKEKLALEYYNAMWTIQWLGKKSEHPKPLQEILNDLYKEKKVMSDDQMLNQVKILNSLFGGKVKTCNS